MRAILIVMTAVAVSGPGCEKDKTSDPGAPSTAAAATLTAPATVAAPPAPPPTVAPAPAAAEPAAKKVEIEIASVGDTMAFDKTKLTVPAGSDVHLVLKNNGTIPAMSHNWVLVKTGKEAAVAAAGLEKGPSAGYFAQTDDVLAATPLAAPKGNVEVTFKAPPAGKYPYICTFPGHYMMMKGELTVTP